jgi:predicted RNase H-like HicB family nuclease
MVNEILFLVEESIEGGYSAKAIGESIFTQAETIEELKIQIKDAISVHFDEKDIPKIIRLHIVKEEVLAF